MLDWNELEELSTTLVPDIVIGSDIVYDPSILQPLLNVLNLFYKRNNSIHIYIASIVRNKDTFSEFLRILGNYFSYFHNLFHFQIISFLKFIMS